MPAQGDGMLVALVDDHQLFSASLRAALEMEGYSVVVPELDDAGELETVLKSVPPTVALLDLDLGRFGSGEDVLPVLVDLKTRVLIVSGATDEAVIGRCLHAGAWGWVPKSAPLEQLLESVRLAGEGRLVLGPADQARFLDAWRRHRQTEQEAMAPFERLSRREAAVLSMLQEGKSVERIATESFVSEATVRSHVRAVLTKLGVKSQLEAVAKANRAGWSDTA